MRLLQYEIYNLVQDGTSEWWKNRQQSFHTELDYFFYYYKKAGRWNEFKAVVTSAISSPLILDNFATTRGIMVTKTKKLLICRLFHHNDAHLTLPLSAPDKGWERLWFLLLTHFLMNSMCADERWRTRKKKRRKWKKSPNQVTTAWWNQTRGGARRGEGVMELWPC